RGLLESFAIFPRSAAISGGRLVAASGCKSKKASKIPILAMLAAYSIRSGRTSANLPVRRSSTPAAVSFSVIPHWRRRALSKSSTPLRRAGSVGDPGSSTPGLFGAAAIAAGEVEGDGDGDGLSAPAGLVGGATTMRKRRRNRVMRGNADQ